MRNNKGFTLIELMLVIIIIGILVAMVLPRFAGRTYQAKIARAKADIVSISVALDMYELDNDSYPTTEQGLSALRQKPTTPPIPNNWKGTYLKKKIPVDPWNNPYHYTCPGVHNEDYDLISYGKDGVEGGGDDVCNWEETQTDRKE
ncbi:MAG: type II secretion system major pseudopilin GspG [bacterium]